MELSSLTPNNKPNLVVNDDGVLERFLNESARGHGALYQYHPVVGFVVSKRSHKNFVCNFDTEIKSVTSRDVQTARVP